ncbi:hypothetical protein [Xanthomonas melonis]|uniref:hypothetical protein n=1 Tax=Xanthomonas melonis TaxID=56456 RepID=UPI0011B0C45C|nr:hypothetical protein [Xanthomonas melonis]MCC4601919.1 hypothetical protein [Xanthomonas melonis]
MVEELIGSVSHVLQTSETGKEINDLETVGRLVGAASAFAPCRQLYVLQVIRYWTELLRELQYLAQAVPGEEIPYFSEIFARFGNDDSFLRTRKTWEKN